MQPESESDPHSPISTKTDDDPPISQLIIEPSDFPPESFWVAEEDADDWFNRNAFIQRNASTKITFSGTSSFGPRQSFHAGTKPKSSIIGLPKSQKACFADGNLRRSFKPGKSRLFRSKSEPGNKPTVHGAEPGSPKVSCMGRVGSKKGKGKRTGLWASLRAVFRTERGANRVVNSKENAEPAGSGGPRRSESGSWSESWAGNSVDEKLSVHVS